MTRHLHMIGLLVALVASVALASNPTALIASLNKQIGENNNILGTAVVTLETNGMVSGASVAAGFKNQGKTIGFQLDTGVRGNEFGEVLLAITTLRLVQSLKLPQLDEAIPARFLPQGFAFVNPGFRGIRISLRMLLTHTSSLRDNIRLNQAPFRVSSGSRVTDIRTFAQSYFLSQVGENFAVATDIWSTNEPGQAASYEFALSNIALLSFVVQQVVADDGTLVTGQQTVGNLVQQYVMNPLGLTQTFFVLPNGDFPLLELNTPMFSNAEVGGNIATPSSSPTIHASYLSHNMVLTSAIDMAKVFRALFTGTAGSTFRAIGEMMTTGMIAIPSNAANAAARPGMSHQGLGIVRFEFAEMCATWRTVNAAPSTTSCPWTHDRPVFGHASSGPFSTVGAYCTADRSTTQVPSTTYQCSAVVSQLSASNTAAAPVSRPAAVAGEAIRQSYSNSAEVSGASTDVITVDSQTRDTVYGFAVFGGLCALLYVVFMASYVAELFVRPAPVTGSVIADAYPKMEIDDEYADEDPGSPLY